MSHRHPENPLEKIERAELEVEYDSLEVLREILHAVREIRQQLLHRPLTARIAIDFGGNMNALSLNVGQSSIGTITPLLADGVTPSGGTLSNVIWTFSDPSTTMVVNPDNTATFTGVAAGTASGTAACTVTDTDEAVAQFSQGFTVTVAAVVPPPPPTQLTQSIGVSFSTPS
jgi:hypothetical protein